MPNLILTRKKQEKTFLVDKQSGKIVEITITQVKGKPGAEKILISIQADETINIHRDEIPPEKDPRLVGLPVR